MIEKWHICGHRTNDEYKNTVSRSEDMRQECAKRMQSIAPRDLIPLEYSRVANSL
ncbi:hypothetical protein KIN20_016499 [Parelaphostrongylus tenuis]|uniref:Uncharacterized protein n=1 Tax=Parelaphostrongylus tenuis TaxID=148309 RepID=A0AAD5QT87_PARTN|nr:hypothetical protein KIN20_016499 [Parelaphostrongylus tenuis]